MSYHDHVFFAKADPTLISGGKQTAHYKTVFTHAGAEIAMNRRQIELCEQMLRTDVVITNTLRGIIGAQLSDEMQKPNSPVKHFFDAAREARGDARELPEAYLIAQREQLATAKTTLRPLRS